MGIRKKYFFLMSVVMLSVLILSYMVIFRYLYHSMREETISRQQAAVELNRQMADNFLRSFTYTAIQVVSDQAIGNSLSTSGESILAYLGSRTALRNQFSHYAAHQVIDNRYIYQNTLFLSDEIPLASYFGAGTLEDISYGSASWVVSNSAVKDQDWYRQTVERVSCIFISKANDFCIARKLNMNYYTGASSPSGQAVMVTSIPFDQLERVFSYTPVTANSSFFAVNSDGGILFGSNEEFPKDTYARIFAEYQRQDSRTLAVTIQAADYLVSQCGTNYGMQLLFLAPEQDIVDSLMPLMRTYTWIFCVIFMGSLVVMYFLSGHLTRSLITLSDTISSIQDTRLFDKSRLNVSREKELAALQDSFSHMIDNTNRLIGDIQLQSERQKRSQLQALQAQINPHFLFNAMDKVNWLALLRGCDDIANIVNSISGLMRYSITKPDSMVLISEEMHNIREFVSIYQLRFDRPLQLVDQIARQDIQIPKFTLQPLVENAARHAKPPQGQELVITVQAWQENGKTLIEVADNGENSDAYRMNLHLKYEESGLKVSGGFGIRNVNERIGLRFPHGSGLSYRNPKEGGLIARIELKL